MEGPHYSASALVSSGRVGPATSPAEYGGNPADTETNCARECEARASAQSFRSRFEWQSWSGETSPAENGGDPADTETIVRSRVCSQSFRSRFEWQSWSGETSPAENG